MTERITTVSRIAPVVQMKKLKRVAAYARVSTGKDAILHSLAAQVSYYSDLIINKSVSRFARNTVDTLTTIRKLKEHGVEVYFEEQNIYTLDGKGEVLLTIMSSIAQEESRNISENVT